MADEPARNGLPPSVSFSCPARCCWLAPDGPPQTPSRVRVPRGEVTRFWFASVSLDRPDSPRPCRMEHSGGSALGVVGVTEPQTTSHKSALHRQQQRQRPCTVPQTQFPDICTHPMPPSKRLSGNAVGRIAGASKGGEHCTDYIHTRPVALIDYKQFTPPPLDNSAFCISVRKGGGEDIW